MRKITSKQMYRLSERLDGAGNYRLWLADWQRSLGLKKWADYSTRIAFDCFRISIDCQMAGDNLYKEGL